MTDPSRNRQAGGFLIAAAILIGTLAGGMAGEPTIGFLTGTGVGILLAILVWLKDRR